MKLAKLVIVGMSILCYWNVMAANTLLITDIHFNPYADCSPAELKPCLSLQKLIETPQETWSGIFQPESLNILKTETNNTFFSQGLQNLGPIAKAHQVNSIFITGDLLSHGFDTAFYKYAPLKYRSQAELSKFSAKVMEFVLAEIRAELPGTQMFFVLGNNDSDRGDYQRPSTQWLRTLAKYLNVAKDSSAEFMASYAEGGYFRLPYTAQSILIGLNTDILSAYNPDRATAHKQLVWLRQQLQLAQQMHQNVIILEHIPFGVDVYNTIKYGRVVSLLDSKLQAEYLELLQQYAANVSIIFAGHFHGEYFEVINNSTPLIGSIAFNGLFGNYPGFKIVDIDSSGQVQDYTTYITDFSTKQIHWQTLYAFKQTYGPSSQIVPLLIQFSANPNESHSASYRKYYNGNNLLYPQPISLPVDWIYYSCGIKYQESSAYRRCIQEVS